MENPTEKEPVREEFEAALDDIIRATERFRRALTNLAIKGKSNKPEYIVAIITYARIAHNSEKELKEIREGIRDGGDVWQLPD